jgi:diguanylate cyclase (GGDEF)-like protein
MKTKSKILIINNTDNNDLFDIIRHDFIIYQYNNIKEIIDTIEQEDEISAILIHYELIENNNYTFIIDEYKDVYPIIVYGNADESNINKCLADGCSDYFTLPFNNKLILKRLETIITSNMNNSFQDLSEKDPITGLFTRESFEKHSREMLDIYNEEKFDMICIDFKNFKLFNNKYGTKRGNNLLKFAADKISLIMGNDVNVARLNGDIFIMLIRRPSKYDDNYFLKLIEAINEFPSEEKFILKFGIYQIKDNNSSISGMYDRAIIACDSIKKSYMKNYTFFNGSMLQNIEDESFFALSVKSAMIENQFVVYYQPKFSLNTEKIAGAESLVRWLHPVKGFISPSEFIPYFEKTEFITELDYYVWDVTCSNIRQWLDEGIDVVPISVNVSRIDLYDEGLCDYLISLTDKYNLDRKYLHLEITESAYTHDYDKIIEVVSKLRNLGFKIEMDDFGTGYSSLTSLSDLPVDILKLDIKLIEKLDSDDGQNIMNFIRELALMMNLSIIAEGVESSDQIKILKRFKCDYVQGYYYSKPMKDIDFKNQLLIPDLAFNHVKELNDSSEIQIIENINCNEAVLLIGDNKESLEELIRILKNSYNLFICNNLKESINFVTKEKNNICSVIVQFGKSENSYWNIVETFNNNIDFYNLPIIVNTQFDNYIIKHAYQKGVKDVFVNPLIPISILQRLENVINSTNYGGNNVESINMVKFAYQDYLTKLSNRRGFERKFNKLIISDEDIDCSLFMIDIDNFQEFLDLHNHDRGDQLIKDLAIIIKANFRNVDILARFSTNRFIAVMTGIYNESIITQKADTIIQQVHNLDITCSAGVLIFNSKNITKVDLIKKAENALSEAKSAGKNCSKIIKI